MKEFQERQRSATPPTKTLWQQLTPQQQAQMAVVMLRILRQWGKQNRIEEVEDETVKLGV